MCFIILQILPLLKGVTNDAIAGPSISTNFAYVSNDPVRLFRASLSAINAKS